MRSNIIIWIVYPPLPWIYQLSYPLRRVLSRLVWTAALKLKNRTWTNIWKTINDIKDNHLKVIASAFMNLSDIAWFDRNIYPPSVKYSFEVEKFEPENNFEKTINEIKYNYFKISPPLTLMYQLSLRINPLRLLNI